MCLTKSGESGKDSKGAAFHLILLVLLSRLLVSHLHVVTTYPLILIVSAMETPFPHTIFDTFFALIQPWLVWPMVINGRRTALVDSAENIKLLTYFTHLYKPFLLLDKILSQILALCKSLPQISLHCFSFLSFSPFFPL